MKILSVVGARPQFIKLGPLSRELRKFHEEIIIHTGQHYDHEMSDLFFNQLEIQKPDMNLAIGSASHGEQTGLMLAGIEKEIIRIKPDMVLSFGDTNSTLAACLAASKLQVPSLHIEAGLRSFNRSMPEEINRVVADHVADLLFAPTQKAMYHLKNEGLAEKSLLTGDIMADSVDFVQSKIGENKFEGRNYSLLTLHRPYNVDNPDELATVFDVLGQIETEFVFPVHPRTKSIISNNNIKHPPNITLLPPQGYIEFQGLLKYADKVITDSGGLQKEAYIAGKPCITVRPETEWVETVEAGWNILKSFSDEDFIEVFKTFNPLNSRPNLYGNNVAQLMVKEINHFLLYQYFRIH